MLSREEIAEIIAGEIVKILAKKHTDDLSEENFSEGKIFLSDHELRKMKKPGQKRIVVPKNSIISPLAMDWIEFEGIEIVFENK
jgi:hypothetical protein